jgi:hypothetical protein
MHIIFIQKLTFELFCNLKDFKLDIYKNKITKEHFNKLLET